MGSRVSQATSAASAAADAADAAKQEASTASEKTASLTTKIKVSIVCVLARVHAQLVSHPPFLLLFSVVSLRPERKGQIQSRPPAPVGVGGEGGGAGRLMDCKSVASEWRMDVCMIQELEKQAVDMNKKALDAAAAATAAKVRTHARTHARESTADTLYTHVRHTHNRMSRLERLSKAKATAPEDERLV